MSAAEELPERERLSARLRELAARRKLLRLNVSAKTAEIARVRADIAQDEHELRCLEDQENEARVTLARLDYDEPCRRTKR